MQVIEFTLSFRGMPPSGSISPVSQLAKELCRANDARLMGAINRVADEACSMRFSEDPQPWERRLDAGTTSPKTIRSALASAIWREFPYCKVIVDDVETGAQRMTSHVRSILFDAAGIIEHEQTEEMWAAHGPMILRNALGRAAAHIPVEHLQAAYAAVSAALWGDAGSDLRTERGLGTQRMRWVIDLLRRLD